MGPTRYELKQTKEIFDAIRLDINVYGIAIFGLWPAPEGGLVAWRLPPEEVDAYRDDFGEKMRYMWKVPEEWKRQQIAHLPPLLQDLVWQGKDVALHEPHLWVFGRPARA